MASRSPKARLTAHRQLKAHPLAGRRVVCNADLFNGRPVYVVGWAEHVDGRSIGKPGEVLILVPVSPDDLPAYDLVPVGTIS